MTTQTESVGYLQRRVDDLEKVCANLNARLAAIDPSAAPLLATRRKVLEIDQRLALIERGPFIPAGQPFSE